MNVDDDNLEQDDEEDDDNGEYDKFSGQKNPMRRQKEQSNNQEVPNQTRTIENETKEVELTEQAFNPDDSALPPIDSDEDVIPARVKISQLTSVYFMERFFRKGRCYYATNKTGGRIIYGIKSFYSETAANCVEIVHYSKTFLGTGDCSEKFASILELEGCRYMQKTRVEVIHLGDLENDSLLPHPVELPKRIYDPRTNKKSQSFAFLYDRDNSNEIKVNREHTRVVEAFAGAGGMHLGFEDEGFETAMAIELDDAAVKTFEHNNPDVPTFEDGDVLKFIQKMDQDLEFREKVGPVEVIHTSSPCQGFSKANRNVEESERDAQNNSLSYTFYELLCVTGALIGTFENVEGMWSQKGMPYLKRLLVDCIELGYQVKVMLLRGKCAASFLV
mgnify:CR=1 FL=1